MSASLYDILTVEDKQYYRVNKDIIKKKDVPQQVLEILTADNVVDENGMLVVDQKLEEAQAPTEDNLKELGTTKLTRRDQKENSGENQNDQEGENTDDAPDEDTEDAPSPEDDTEDTEEEDEGDKAPAPEPAAPQKPARAASTKPVDEPAFRSKVPQSRPGMGFPRVNGKTVDIFDGKTPHTHLKVVGGVAVPLSAESFRTKSDFQIQKRLDELGVNTINFEEIERSQSEKNDPGNAGNADTLMLDESESDDSVTD